MMPSAMIQLHTMSEASGAGSRRFSSWGLPFVVCFVLADLSGGDRGVFGVLDLRVSDHFPVHHK